MQISNKNQLNSGSGFTLIELLVVVIIMGILSAIALPSFLSQTNKAKQVEAKSQIGAINRAQQTYFVEKNSFAANLEDLGLGFRTTTANYQYRLDTNVAGGGKGIAAVANPVGVAYKAYVGGVGLIYEGAFNQQSVQSVLCESKRADTVLSGTDVTITTGVSGTGGGGVTCNDATSTTVE